MKKILLLLVIFLFFTNTSYAADNFLTDYNVTYNVAKNGLTHVNFKISLTNKTENYYASSYKVNLGVNDIENVRGADGGGIILPDVTKDSTGTTIGLQLTQKIVGLNKKTSFSLDFDTTDIAQSLGRILEVNIPGLSNQDDFSSFAVNVITPSSVSTPAYIKPDVGNLSSNTISFNKSTLGRAGVYIAYGDYQAYSFDLTYHIYNNNLFSVRTEIALPPKTNYQDIEIDKIDPAPTDVKVDSDGNWLAQYTLPASKKINVHVTGKARVFLNPSQESLSESMRTVYLKPHSFWQSDNLQIKKTAQELKTPKNIYDYVVRTLSYDFSRVSGNKPRLGAIGVLNNPTSAVCLEFTDLFIALSRAAGIPSREVDGYAYTKNTRERPLSLVKDVLHAWPQYYDDVSKTWIMVDPTWGNTTGGVDYFNTLDFDHLTFAIKGNDSSYPVPAGGYKFSGQENTKDVLVNVDSDFADSLPVLKTDLEISKSAIPWAPITGKLTITNNGNQITQKQDVKIDTKISNPNHQTISVDPIPPYGKTTIPLKFTTPSVLTNSQDTVTITFGEKSFTQNVLISPFNFSKTQLIIVGGILIALFTLIISIITAKLWNLHFFRRKK